MMLSGINVFKSTLLVKALCKPILADLVIKTFPHYAIPFCVLHLQRSNTPIYRMNFFLTRGGYLHFKTTYKYKSMPCYN